MLVQAKIIKGLEIKAMYGYLTISNAFSEGTIFYTSKTGSAYKVVQQIKTTGYATYEIKIKRCDLDLSEIDKEILKEKTKIKILTRPTGIQDVGYTK